MQKGKAPNWTPLPPGNGFGGINLQLILGLINLQKQGQGLPLWPTEVPVRGRQPRTPALSPWGGGMDPQVRQSSLLLVLTL